MGGRSAWNIQTIVVDNGSKDRTGEIAIEFGARVVKESERNISKARNAGSRCHHSDLLVFIDADTWIPPSFFSRIVQVMEDPACVGGAVATLHTSNQRILRTYFKCWRLVSKWCHLAQGAAQFCLRDVFLTLGGYDETIFMGEDALFFRKMKREARKNQGNVVFIDDIQVKPSPRRFDRWPLWKTLLWTNPVWIALLSRQKWVWRAWYQHPIR